MSLGHAESPQEELAELPQGGLPVFEGESWEEHVSAAISLKEEIGARLWELAAVCASVSTRYGEQSIPKFAKEIDYSARRVYEMAATHVAWQNRERSQILSFAHHTIAAKSPEPEKAIETAEVEQWSTRRLASHVHEEETRELEAEYGQVIEVKTITCPTCDGEGVVPAED